ncbi:CLC_0170 family protein [Clostridium ihumii]|uniref:CLC_0170 family protein n=1 Tax=Clostridium ihumii TaxID=1470356 RepID=UPI000553A4FB|nr:CLC_0170 family protein [Clostridium ihumii]
MRIITACDGYLLMLVVLIGMVGFFLDANYFKNQNKMKAYKESKIINGVVVLITIVMFIVRTIFIV